MDVTPSAPPADRYAGLGLRERKKLRTRMAIRRATYRLMARQGYEATTVEQIAEAAEVSPSTVFRYFPTKEDIVLTDEYDPLMADLLRSRPAGEPPLESLRHVVKTAVDLMQRNEPDEMVQRSRLMAEVPAVRARMTETMSETSKLLTGVLAERTGRSADELELRVFTAGVMAVMREVSLYWAEHGCGGDLRALLDRGVDAMGGDLRAAPAGARPAPVPTSVAPGGTAGG